MLAKIISHWSSLELEDEGDKVRGEDNLSSQISHWMNSASE